MLARAQTTDIQPRRQHDPYVPLSDLASPIYHPPSSPLFVINNHHPHLSTPLPSTSLSSSHHRSHSQPRLSANLIASSPHFISPSAPSAYYLSYASPTTPYNTQINDTTIPTPVTAGPQLMQNIFDFNTSQPLYSPGYSASPVEAVAYPQQYWYQSQNNMASAGSPAMANAALQQRGVKRSHNRTLSATSSVASNRSRSPYGQSAPSFHQEPSGLAKSSTSAGVDAYRGYQHNLPTPTQTPTQDSFQYQSQGQQHDQAAIASAAMARAFEQQSATTDDDMPGMSRSGRHSVSSYGPEPTTPHGAPENFDDGFKVPSQDTVPRIQVPKFDRTMSDIYQDECYNPAPVVAPRSNGPKSAQPQQFLSPFRNEKVTQALQAAQLARAQSPASQVYAQRGVSPFRPDSPWVKTMPRGNNAQQSGQQAQQPASSAVTVPTIARQESMKTISPKDALLDYRDDDSNGSMSLFPDTSSSNYDGAAQYLVPTSTASRSGWNAQYAAQTPSQPFSMAVPSQTYNVLPFNTQQYRTAKSEENPSFPAQLISMESSCSEAPASSQSSAVQLLAKVNSNQSTTKPESSAAASGTYTCTYNNCTQRFETAQRLQKHKREQHKQPSTSSAAAQAEPVLVAHPSQIPKPDYTPGVGSGMTSADLLARNSQTGPHKCERINPTTGKPCNSVFSRPYDLTRHEDTIHNNKKLKVRCALCVEEKTFSRNDALTRHMRVVHPEVDFPGKHRKKSDARAY